MTRSSRLAAMLMFALTAFGLASLPGLVSIPARAQTPPPASAPILTRDTAGPLIPAQVFFAGQIAPTQARNSGGVRWPSGKLFLATLVDTSGYSSSIQQTYQGYLLLQAPVRLGDSTLPAGAYGFGFVSGDRMIVLDLGNNQLLTTPTTRDAALARPTPLQILPNPGSSTSYRLYLGRSFVIVRPAQ